ncbi:MAG TPA: hypothetical protein VHS80_02920, partial [Chthoniobacterales bacterium]|nr:hypothetical protein [Chthoniobacterales bacterium]
MTIGSPNAAQFEFEDGLLRSIEIERRRKTVLSAKESFLNAFPLNFAPVTRPYMPRAHGEPGAEYPTLHSNQKLGSGIRDIEVKQSREQTSKREAGIRVASLENRFQMSSAATWVLLLEDVVNLTEEERTKLLFQMPDKVRLTVESTEPIQSQLEVIDGRLRASIQVTLPVGHSSLRLEVRSFPAFDFSKTVVFCRSDQLREAAIVVSCVPEHGFTPVVTLEPPPVSAEEYKKLSRIAEASRNAYVAAAGAKLGGSGDPAEYQKVRFKWEHDQQSLTPYRSWQKRNARVSEILNGAGIEVALILFEPEDEDIRIDDPLYLEEFHRFASLMAGDKSAPEATEGILANFRRRIFFLHKSETISDSESDEDCRYHYRDLRELSQKAWSKLTSNRQPASDAIEVPAEGSNTYLMGLFCALRHGLPLRPGNPSTSGLQETFDATNEAIDTDEAVLVEDYGDSTTALGVLYANYRAARLIIVPSPDLSEVERAIASFQNRIDAASKSVSSAAEPSSRAQEICPVLPLENKAPDDKGSRSPPHADEKSGHMADLLWTFLSNSGRTEPYAEIEAAVSVQVPSSLPESVGGRRLTVFTKGLPYSFFNPPGTEWSRKPIGHVVGDPALIVLSEIYANGLDRPEAAFSAVFDPGFFRTSETKDVLASIRLHFTHPMVFSNQNANFDALTRLAGMPLELIFFNTHGSDDAIVLADGPLENYQLLQWLKLKSFPVVFNNSCKSWIGTG